MANEDYAQKMKDALGKFPVDTSALENLAKSQAELAEKMSSIAIEAAQRSTDLYAHWVQDTLSKLPAVTRAQAEPADYAKAAAEFMSGSTEVAAENLAAFAEIARRVQAETLALLLSAGKDLTKDATNAARTSRATGSRNGAGT
jgi:hypothetical protein